MHRNLVLATDSYKLSMWRQYPPGTTHVHSYIEARGGRWPVSVFFGLQAFIKDRLTTPVTQADIEEAAEVAAAHGEPFNRAGWEHILRRHGGFLPLAIRAVDEGTVVPTRNVLATVENTDPECFWLTTYVETMLLRGLWYPSTVATNSFMAKAAILEALDASCDDPAGQVAFRLHDFGARGASSGESAALGGMAHLVNFMGTDTMESLLAARRFYGEPMAGFSIAAAEHSTITAWGRDREADAYRNMLAQFGGAGKTVAVVSDSYDLMRAVRHIWGDALRQAVLDSGATVVVRPDSGDPETVPVEVVRLLAERFGSAVNGKGYRVLPPSVRVIQGDGITLASLRKVLANLLAAGFGAENVAFGMGAGLLQQVDRDTLGWAMKASAACIGGEWHDVYKEPRTDPGKRSKRGRLALVRSEAGDLVTERAGARPDDENLLRPAYENGRLLRETSFAELRARTHAAALAMAAQRAEGYASPGARGKAGRAHG